MPELRWTLLVLGVIFIVALTIWERRRPRHASRAEHEPHREPTLTLPEVRVREATMPRELPVVTVTDDSWESLHVDRSARGELGPGIAEAVTASRRDPADEGAAASAERMAPVADEGSATSAERMAPVADESSATSAERMAPVADEVSGSDLADEYAREAAASFSEPAVPASDEPFMPDDGELRRENIARRAEEPRFHVPESAESQGLAESQDAAEAEDSAAADLEAEGSAEVEGVVGPGETVEQPALDIRGGPLDVIEPIVDWPPDDVRKVLALRLVASGSARFAGRAVRQALSAEGFVLGKFEIFHKPGADHRAVLSVASLTKPGTFDPDTMDSRHYNGLSLFAVLPGPKKPRQAFEDLLHTARNLNERLQGALQDERGGPLTPMRIDALRSTLGVEAES
ncbi:MAG TPA: cell division protein ZipA C-terminal FtsZ-binding domain-containing protein [Steroidobacteraceae bacterium]|nr:cell division protein ZipA C-terminal FtsZ-binding domain-containing protein [Steroidobacteraceae bacterium]